MENIEGKFNKGIMLFFDSGVSTTYLITRGISTCRINNSELSKKIRNIKGSGFYSLTKELSIGMFIRQNGKDYWTKRI